MSTQTHKDNPEQVQARMHQSQLIEASPFLEATPDASTQTQLAFAQSAFANIQELNRTMDQKANYLLAAVALLTTALGLVVSRAITATAQNDWQLSLKVAGILLMLLYLFLAFAVIFVATSIYQARSHSRRVPPADANAPTAAPGMLFPLMLLERFSVADKVDEAAYLSKLKTLKPDDVLQDYVNQIIEVSIIYREKQKQVNLGLRLFRWTGILWLITMVAVVIISVVLP